MTQGDGKLGTMPIRPLVLNMAWPIMLSMFISACYNLVDSIFVAKISEEAFLALSLSFPVQTMMIAINSGTGVGINALLSRYLGQKDRSHAALVAMNGLFLFVLIWVVYLLFGLFCVKPFFSFYTDDPLVQAYGLQYLRIVCCCSIGQAMCFATQRILHATGHPTGHMVVQGIGAIINLILDPILIFGLFGFPCLGVQGAAIATVVGQILGGSIGLILVSRIREIPLRLRCFRPSGKIAREIYRIGFPAIITQALMPVMSAGLNRLLGLYSDTLVLVLGIYYKLQTFILMPIYGLNNGIIPVISYNYGARNKDRIVGAIRFSLVLSVSIMLVATCVFELWPPFLLHFFSPEPDTLTAGIFALRIIALSFPLFAATLILSGSFQVFGASHLTLVVSALRQLLIVFPVAWVLCQINPFYVWFALPIAECAGLAVALLLFRRIYRTTISPLQPPTQASGVQTVSPSEV